MGKATSPLRVIVLEKEPDFRNINSEILSIVAAMYLRIGHSTASMHQDNEQCMITQEKLDQGLSS